MDAGTILITVAACLIALLGSIALGIVLRTPLKLLDHGTRLAQLEAEHDITVSKLAKAVRRWGREQKGKGAPGPEPSDPEPGEPSLFDQLDPGVLPEGNPAGVPSDPGPRRLNSRLGRLRALKYAGRRGG